MEILYNIFVIFYLLFKSSKSSIQNKNNLVQYLGKQKV